MDLFDNLSRTVVKVSFHGPTPFHISFQQSSQLFISNKMTKRLPFVIASTDYQYPDRDQAGFKIDQIDQGALPVATQEFPRDHAICGQEAAGTIGVPIQ